MKRMRLHIYILIGFFLITFILGSIFDYQINKALFSDKNTSGLILSVIGTIPGYGMLAVLGGGFIALGLKKQYKLVFNIIFYILAAVLVVLGIFFSGREFFGPNGFTNEKIKFVGYIIATPIMGGLGFLGYYLFKKSEAKYLLPLLIIMGVLIFIALVPGVTLLKSIFHRPRYRSIQLYEAEGLVFHNWWTRCENYEALMGQFNLLKEEFKSFPSGHAGASLVFAFSVNFLPKLDKKYEPLQIPLFYAGFIWTILISFSRLWVGAHFLSDVSMGALITAICLLIGNELVINLKFFKEEKLEEKKEEKVAA